MTNNNIKYIDIGINSATDYWSMIVTPLYSSFQRNISPATVFPLAVSLWHVHEWVWHEDHPGENTRSNNSYDQFKTDLFNACPDLRWLQDVADASKHRGLSRSSLAITAVHHHPPISGAIGAGPIGSMPIGGSLPASMTIIMSDDTVGDLVVSLKSAHAYWQTKRFSHLIP